MLVSCDLVDRFSGERNTQRPQESIRGHWTLDVGRSDLDFYFNRAPFGTSSVNVARTGFPSSPTDAARSIP